MPKNTVHGGASHNLPDADGNPVNVAPAPSGPAPSSTYPDTAELAVNEDAPSMPHGFDTAPAPETTDGHGTEPDGENDAPVSESERRLADNPELCDKIEKAINDPGSRVHRGRPTKSAATGKGK